MRDQKQGDGKRRELYLAKANEADGRAAKANGDDDRQVWKAIADGYRELASLTDKQKGG